MDKESFYQPSIQYCFSSSKALRVANSANADRFVVVCFAGYNQATGVLIVNNIV